MNFDSFTRYGLNPGNLRIEVREDIQGKLEQAFSTLPFNRNAGLGVDSQENESFDDAALELLKAQVVSSLSDYNAVSVVERQIVISQELIRVFMEQSAVIILVYFFMLSDLLNPAAQPTEVLTIV